MIGSTLVTAEVYFTDTHFVKFMHFIGRIRLDIVPGV